LLDGELPHGAVTRHHHHCHHHRHHRHRRRRRRRHHHHHLNYLLNADVVAMHDFESLMGLQCMASLDFFLLQVLHRSITGIGLTFDDVFNDASV